jgi:hypothetical protein
MGGTGDQGLDYYSLDKACDIFGGCQVCCVELGCNQLSGVSLPN